MRPSFFSIALKPKWLAALVLALAAAAVCAILGQWQLERSFRVTNDHITKDSIVQLNQITQPSSGFKENLADRRVTATVKVQSQTCSVIGNRRQLVEDGTTKPGYWVVTDSTDTLGAHLYVAHGFTDQIVQAKQICADRAKDENAKTFQPIIGRYEPTEEPQPAESGEFKSFSIPQLINVHHAKPISVYGGFVVMESSGFDPRLQSILIGVKSSDAQVNLLNAFYAIEWAIFAGFALFLWYRLIQDERDRRAADSEALN